jgi:FkbM family methyltransferase
MRFHTTDNVSERKFLFMPQFFDPAERQFLADHLTANGAFLDVGANAGIYTLTAGAAYERLGGSGRVLSVEANPMMVERLKTNVSLNDFRTRVKVAPVALSDKAGEVTFTISDTNLGESGLISGGGRQITVQAQSMAGLLDAEGIAALDGLKIDVEGAEDLILTSFFRSSPRARFPKFIVIENSSKIWKTDLFGLFRELGYQQRFEHRRNVVFKLSETA